LFTQIGERLGKGEDLVLAVIVKASGSTPRGAGAMMLIGREGRLWGTIGGAVPEHLAIEEGKKLLGEKHSALRDYILRPNEAADIGAKCGGELSVFLLFLNAAEPRLLPIIEAGIQGFSGAEPSWFIFSLHEGTPALGLAGKGGIIGWTGEQPGDLQPLLRSRPRAEKNWFSSPLVLAGFVYIFGGGHVAQALAPLLSGLEFRCIIFDDREEFTRPELFPDNCRTILGDFENIGLSLSLTEKDYSVIVTRGHLFDFQSWAFALRSEAAYIGIIGSRTKQEFVRARLQEAGFTPEEMDAGRVHAPIGIAINSKTPAEVAVSIAAEMILTRSKLGEDG
jgi:xanthine dehydrogenase accessory factor